MSLEVHIDWMGQTHLVGRLHAAERGSSVSFEYALEWLQRADAFAIDPTSLPMQRGAHHGRTLFGAIQDCGPDRWGRNLIERAVRKKHYDDHLRNHGFLMREPGRWSLSPAYDLNPVPEMDRARMSKTAITEDQVEPTIADALAAAERFGLKAAESKKILREVFAAVSGWRKTGRQLRVKASTLDAYASAFEHPLMDETRRLFGR